MDHLLHGYVWIAHLYHAEKPGRQRAVIFCAARLNPLHAPSNIQMQRGITEFILSRRARVVNFGPPFRFLIPTATLPWSRFDGIEV